MIRKDYRPGRREARRQELLTTVAKMTPDQIDAFIEVNVTDLASAKDVLKKMGRVLVAIAGEQRGEE